MWMHLLELNLVRCHRGACSVKDEEASAGSPLIYGTQEPFLGFLLFAIRHPRGHVFIDFLAVERMSNHTHPAMTAQGDAA